jgi:uncharacterized membrane protein
MTAFLPLILMLVAFVAVHTAISRPRIRDPLMARLGRRWYGALHGTVSTVGMAAVFWGYYMAPYLELWPPLAAFRAIPALLMPLACILTVASVTTPCAGLTGDCLPEGDNPAPAILSITRHPVPWALVLWGAAHVIANGDLAGLLFFGIFLAFGALGVPLVDMRRRRLCGEDAWKRFAAASPTLPFAGPGPVDWRGIGWKPVLLGLVLYVAIVLSHGFVIGVEAINL